MTNDELKALCERVLEDEFQWGDVLQECQTPAIARSCLKLLAQCDAMREWLRNARNQAAHDALPGLIIAIDNMLSHLEAK